MEEGKKREAWVHWGEGEGRLRGRSMGSREREEGERHTQTQERRGKGEDRISKRRSEGGRRGKHGDGVT